MWKIQKNIEYMENMKTYGESTTFENILKYIEKYGNVLNNIEQYGNIWNFTCMYRKN